jgi:hypothetical protein
VGAARGFGVPGRGEMAYDETRAVVAPTYMDDTWEWDGAIWRQRAVSGPAGRAAHGMTYDAQREVVLVFGGLAAGGITYDDTWEFDGDAWTQIDALRPDARYNAPIQFDAARGSTVLFGGLRGGPSWEMTHGF